MLGLEPRLRTTLNKTEAENNQWRGSRNQGILARYSSLPDGNRCDPNSGRLKQRACWRKNVRGLIKPRYLVAELNGFVENAMTQHDALRAVHGWHDGAAEYEYVLIAEGQSRCAFRIIYEYERADIAADGSNAKGFLAEIVYNWRFCPHHFFPPKEISEFAVASIKGRDDNVGLLEILQPARNLIRSHASKT